MSADKPVVHVAIYDRPEDYPQGCVVRCWYIFAGSPPVPADTAKYFPTRALARAWVEQTHPDLVRMEPTPYDVRSLCDTYV